MSEEASGLNIASHGACTIRSSQAHKLTRERHPHDAQAEHTTVSQYELLTSQPRGPQDAAKQATKTQMKAIMMSPAVTGILVPVKVTAVRMPVAICMAAMREPQPKNRTFLPHLHATKLRVS